MSQNPRLSICIPTFNHVDWLKGCLEACFAQIDGLPVEVVVSDNASDDGTREYLESLRHPALVVHRNEKNIVLENFCKVVEVSHGDYCWLMGDDDIPEPGAIQKVLDALAGSPDWVLIESVWVEHADKSRSLSRFIQNQDRCYFDLSQLQDMTELATRANSLAAFGGLLSVLIGRADLLLEGFDNTEEWGGASSFPHVAAFLQSSSFPDSGLVSLLHEPLVTYREYNSPTDPWTRVMIDLRAWVQFANMRVLGHPRFPTHEARDAWFGVLRRHHGFKTLPTLRMFSSEERPWEEARALLSEVGYSGDAISVAEAIPVRLGIRKGAQ